MDRAAVYREIVQVFEYYRSLPANDLLALVDAAPFESQVCVEGESLTLSVDVRRHSAESVRVSVSALRNNWWRFERIDESVVVPTATAID